MPEQINAGRGGKEAFTIDTPHFSPELIKDALFMLNTLGLLSCLAVAQKVSLGAGGRVAKIFEFWLKP